MPPSLTIFWIVVVIFVSCAPVFAHLLLAKASPEQRQRFAASKPNYWAITHRDPTEGISTNPVSTLGFLTGILARIYFIVLGNGFRYLYYHYITSLRIRYSDK